MFCSNCGTQNPDTSKFCRQCGHALQSSNLPSPVKRPIAPSPAHYQPAKPASPFATAATTGGLAGMAGGSLIILGWFIGGGMPILSLIFAGGLLGSLARGGVGAFFVLLALALAAIVVSVPIVGFLCAQTGVRLFELRAYHGSNELYRARQDLQQLRQRSTVILAMMILIAAFVPIIPLLGRSLLGNGYWLMVSGAVIVFLGTLFARSQLSPNVVTGSPRPNRQHSQELRDTNLTTSPKLGGRPQDTALLSNQIQLDREERQMLWLLAEGLSDVEIAARMNLSDMQVKLVKSTLLNTFGAADKIELIKLARTQGLLPPS